MYRIVMEPGIRETFSNVEVVLRFYLTLFVSNRAEEMVFNAETSQELNPHSCDSCDRSTESIISHVH